VESIRTNVLVAVLKDVLLRLNYVSLVNCRGQCYDGAANIADIKQVYVATQISEYE